MWRRAAREVLDQVIAGEYPIALQIFNHHAVISAKKGAPVDWIKMEPATGTLVGDLASTRTRRIPTPPSCWSISSSRRKARRSSATPTTSPPIRRCRRSIPALKPEDGHFRVRFFTPETTREQPAEMEEDFR